ncbi:MAG: hypothetical protein U1D67_08080 [Dehalococcoidia bacterium]|nr:hypothetical protein [Dehalococcoidia bacterium]MDZ4247062.1 hypothetical protein [Dehalococcoidia bacterium]
MIKKLRIHASGDRTEQVIDIEDARAWNYYDPTALVVVENEMVRSYGELVDIASHARFSGKDILDVHFMVTLTGG